MLCVFFCSCLVWFTQPFYVCLSSVKYKSILKQKREEDSGRLQRRRRTGREMKNSRQLWIIVTGGRLRGLSRCCHVWETWGALLITKCKGWQPYHMCRVSGHSYSRRTAGHYRWLLLLAGEPGEKLLSGCLPVCQWPGHHCTCHGERDPDQRQAWCSRCITGQC